MYQTTDQPNIFFEKKGSLWADKSMGSVDLEMSSLMKQC